MDKDNCLVQVEGEDGKVFNMLILKEFDYKEKKYAVLTEIDKCECEEEKCHCNEDCDCEEEKCHCNEDCECEEDKNCTCSDKKCHCGCEECHSDEEEFLCLLEITKDKDGNEVFKSIDDENLFNELVEEVDKVLYED